MIVAHIRSVPANRVARQLTAWIEDNRGRHSLVQQWAADFLRRAIEEYALNLGKVGEQKARENLAARAATFEAVHNKQLAADDRTTGAKDG